MEHYTPRMTSSRRGQHGLTLIELLVTVVIIGILATLGVPSFTETLRAWQRDSATKALTTHLQLARAEAIKTSRMIVVCPSANGTACTGNTDWKGGWIVFSDDDKDQAVDASERIVAVKGAITGISTMTSSDSVDALVFLPSGLLGEGATTVTITPNGGSPKKINKVTLSIAGRPIVKTETTS